LRCSFEQKRTDQINSGEEDSGQNCAAQDRENRIRQLKERMHERDRGAGCEKRARIGHDDGNHPYQLADQAESPTVNDFEQKDDDS
jgi:hypothetical protein